MAIKSKEELDVKGITVLADKGYWNGEELKKCEEANITTIVSSPKETENIENRLSEIQSSVVVANPIGKKKYMVKNITKIMNEYGTSYMIPKDVVPLYYYLFRKKYVQKNQHGKIIKAYKLFRNKKLDKKKENLEMVLSIGKER